MLRVKVVLKAINIYSFISSDVDTLLDFQRVRMCIPKLIASNFLKTTIVIQQKAWKIVPNSVDTVMVS